MHRQLIKNLEDESVQYDRSVRNTKHQIIQYNYVDCGIKQNMQNHVEIFLLKMSDDQILSMYGKDMEKRMINYRNKLLKIQSIARIDYETLQTTFQLPINLLRLVQKYSIK